MVIGTLNQNTTLDPGSAATFKGPVEKVLLPAGTRLFKLSAFNPSNSRHGGAVTGYWSNYEATTRGDWGWSGFQRMCRQFNVSERELARLVSAVKLEWNDLTWVWTVSLQKPVYGWHGHAAAQHKTGNQGIKLTGMNLQYYIPNLTPWHITVNSMVRAS